MARLKRKRVWLVSGVALVLVLVGAVIATWPLLGKYTGAAPPEQFTRKVALDPALNREYQHVLGVAHNAGNNPTTEATALRSGASVIEIDVTTARGELAAGRNQGWPWLAEQVFLGPSLVQAWDEAAKADITKLDLKQSSHQFLNDLAAFLNQRSVSRHVMVASRDWQALMYLHRHTHRVTLLYSVAYPDAVHRLQTDPALDKAISGVSVYQGLVDHPLVSWVHEHNMQLVAWTVNDGPEFNHLVRLGVDGITTDNLAILKALRTQR
jgi:hypothetical protein